MTKLARALSSLIDIEGLLEILKQKIENDKNVKRFFANQKKKKTVKDLLREISELVDRF